MTIERKIREIDISLISASNDYFDGFRLAQHKSAILAEETDALMAEIMDALEDAADMLEVNNKLGAESEARAVITKFYNWKERTQ